MKQVTSNPFSFLSGIVQDRNVGRVIAQVDELKEAGSTNSRLLRWTRSDGKWQSYRLKWHAIRLGVIPGSDPVIVAIGPDGSYIEGTSAGPSEGYIDNSDDGPNRRGDIRDLRIIGGHAYATGMSRQIYRREAAGVWHRFDDGVVQPRGAISVAGFNAIDGLDENNIYAVGFNGEIWHFQNLKWTRIDSPTGVVLHRVRTVRDNIVFACGQEGVLIEGFDSQWRIVEHGISLPDLWGMEWFNDRLYVACDDGLYALKSNDVLEKINIGLGDNWTFRHLHANDGVLWSFGPKHICWTEDMVTWHDVTP